MAESSIINIAIIGGGDGAALLIDLLHEDPKIKIVGVADRNSASPTLMLANRLNIPATTDYAVYLSFQELHYLIDAADDMEVEQNLDKVCPPHIKLLGGITAKFILNHIIQLDRRKGIKDFTFEELLFQYQSIRDIGIKLVASSDMMRILYYTVEDATRLTATPAGSIALFDEWRGEMYLGAVKGFSDNFSKTLRWSLRQGGLTSTILNAKESLVIADVAQYPGFDNPLMLEEGVRSLMATPLIAEGKIIGILYVDDFKVRSFLPHEASLFSLLGSIAADMIDKAQLLENALRISIVDDLTGLNSHRYFMKRLSNEIKRASHFHLTFTLVMMDIDDFRLYNNIYGHAKGNEVLCQISAILKDHCRDVDVVARYGGEEFAVLMPETTGDTAWNTLNRLREKVACFPFEGREKSSGGQITISIGVVTYPAHGDDVHTLIEKANTMLSQAKELGKNRVVSGAAQG